MNIQTPCNKEGCPRSLSIDVPEGSQLALRMARTYGGLCALHGEEYERQQAELERLAKRDVRRQQSGLPPHLRAIEFPSLTDVEPSVLEAVLDWARDAGSDPSRLLLTGAWGAGKTFLAAAACWARLEHGPCRFLEMGPVMKDLHRDFSDQRRRDAVIALTSHTAAVFDDLDKVDERREVSDLRAALERRMNAGAPILITTNLVPSQIGSKYGGDIKSRLANFRMIKVSGPADCPDRRRQRPSHIAPTPLVIPRPERLAA